MEFQIDMKDFEHFYANYPGAANLRDILHKYQFFGFCRKFVKVFISKRFTSVPTEELIRIYDHFDFTENYDSFRNEELSNDVSEFIIGMKIPTHNSSQDEKTKYIGKIHEYFKQF